MVLYENYNKDNAIHLMHIYICNVNNANEYIYIYMNVVKYSRDFNLKLIQVQPVWISENWLHKKAHQIWGAKAISCSTRLCEVSGKKPACSPSASRIATSGPTGIWMLILDMIWEIQNRHSMLISFCYTAQVGKSLTPPSSTILSACYALSSIHLGTTYRNFP